MSISAHNGTEPERESRLGGPPDAMGAPFYRSFPAEAASDLMAAAPWACMNNGRVGAGGLGGLDRFVSAFNSPWLPSFLGPFVIVFCDTCYVIFIFSFYPLVT
jgi:hypothetical protein